MSNEAMTLIERLHNPAWETNPTGGDALLNVKQTREAMDEAAAVITSLRAALTAIVNAVDQAADWKGDMRKHIDASRDAIAKASA